MLSRTIQNLQNVAVFAVSNMKSFFSAKYLSLEFDAFIAQETHVPFEGLTWQFLRCRIQP